QDYDQNNSYHQSGLDANFYDEPFCQPTTSGQSTNSSFYQSSLEQSKNMSFAGPKDRKDDSSADPNNDRKENGSVDITAMLREIKAEVKGHDIIDESPASPEPGEMSVANAAPLRQTVVRTVEYRLIPFDLPPNDPAFAQNLLKLSMLDVKLSNDPRLKKLLANQFDAVSDLIAGLPQDQKPPPIIGGILQQVSQTKARDPRLKSSSPTNLTVSNFQTPSSENIFPNVPHNQPMLYPPMMPSLPSEMLANMNIPPVFLSPNGPTGWMPHNLQQNPPIGLPPMPVMHGLPNFGASSSHNFPMENDATRDPRSRRARLSRPHPPALSSFYNSTPAASSNSPPDSSKTSTDHRSTISPSPVFEPLTTSEMTNNNNGNISLPAKNDNEQQQQTTLLANAANAFSTAMNLASGASINSLATSLREKRKNLEYESPLNASAMSTVPPQRSSSTDDNSCRFYGAGLKIVKKKESVETS
uniref:Uncharacterized protein n=1 Tax=Romanomermis culicivorax TaxID=13658 RepID=A0A915HHP0_ROMCU